MSDGLFDETSAAGLAQAAEERVLARLRQVETVARTVLAAEEAVAGLRAQIGAIAASLGVAHRWSGSVLQLLNPDGSYGAAVDLLGPAGETGPAPVIVVGTVAYGDVPSAILTPDPLVPNRYLADFVFPRGPRGEKGDTPELADLDLSGLTLAWEKITGKPAFFSGAYDDLTGRPALGGANGVATLDPNSKIPVAQIPLLDAAQIGTGVIDPARIPVQAIGTQVVSAGGLADLTSGQRSAVVKGVIVTTQDGTRYLYTGAGDKADAGSYILLADVTPEWSVIAGKPASYPPAAHAHALADVTGLAAALAALIARAGDQMGGALDFAATVSVASAATTDIGAAASNNVEITGTTAITSFGTRAAGAVRWVRFAAAGLVLTHSAAALILPGAANIATLAGDTAEFRSLGSGKWLCLGYQRADGQALAAVPAPSLDDFRLLAIRVAKGDARAVGLANGVADDFRDTGGVGLPDTNTSLLMHFDGANGAATYTDSSPNAFSSANWVGGARLSTAQAAFGTASLAFTGAGGGRLYSGGSSPGFALGSGDWTVNLRARLNAIGATSFLVDTRGGSSDGNGIYIYVTSAGKVVAGNNGGSLAGSTVLAANTWYDIEVTRAAGTLRIFVNGTLDGTLANFAHTSNSASVCRLGSDADDGSLWAGYIDELRFSPGLARHTASFAPAVAPFNLGDSTNVSYDVANNLITNLVSGSPAAMDLRSNAFPAPQGVPTKGSLFVLVKATAGAISPNANLFGDLSRDGGTTWTTASLVKAGSLSTGFDIYEANGFDISGQPSGSSMKWRLRTIGTALAVAVDAIVASWG